jgi:putative membrane protein insertion efficiency factor
VSSAGVLVPLRRAAWVAGWPARVALMALIRLYRLVFSGWLGGQCRFYPSCSRYAEEAIATHGAARGALLAGWRVLRCGPFTAGGVDHVPRGRGDVAQPAYHVALQGRTSDR